MQRQQLVAVAFRQVVVLARPVHEAARRVVLLDRAARVRRHLHDEHVADGEFGADADEHGGDAAAVGIGQLRQVAGTHQDLDVGPRAAQLRVALERGREAEVDRIEHRIGDVRDALGNAHVDGAQQRVEIAVRARQQDRHALGAVDGIEARFIEAEHVVGAGARAAAQLLHIAGIDAHLEAFALQRRDGFLKMRKLHIRLAADVDHVAALGDQLATARHQLLDREARRIDDLGEDADVLLREVRRLAVVAEELRQVDDLVRARARTARRSAPRGGRGSCGCAPAR